MTAGPTTGLSPKGLAHVHVDPCPEVCTSQEFLRRRILRALKPFRTYGCLVVLSFVVACASNRSTSLSFPKDTAGCFLLYNLKTDSFDAEVGETCKLRLPACSTFKVPLAVIAFDSKVLRDANQTLLWDGKPRMLEVWNRDQNARSWMQHSVVWVSQALTPQLGQDRIESYLRSFKYGNASLSSGLQDAWLHPPNNPGGNLELSAYEQVDFLKRLWTDRLSVSAEAMRMTREIMYAATSSGGWQLSGKTGSNFYAEGRSYQLGWFVAHLKRKGEEYIVVANLSDRKAFTGVGGFGGPRAKELTLRFLKERNLW